MNENVEFIFKYSVIKKVTSSYRIFEEEKYIINLIIIFCKHELVV